MTDETRSDGGPLTRWLRDLPEDTEIAWDDDGQPEGSRFALCSWLDIQIPLAEQDLHWNWIWTITIDSGRLWASYDDDEEDEDSDDLDDEEEYDDLDDEDDEEDEHTSMRLRPDGDALIVERDGERLLAVARFNDGRVVELNDAEIDTLFRHYEHGGGDSVSGYQVLFRPFVTLERVNQTLAAWVAEHCGRTDIRFRFEPQIGPSPMLQQAMERMESYESGEGMRGRTIDFDDPESLSDLFGFTVEEAEEWIAGREERRARYQAQADQADAARHDHIARLLDQLSARLTR